MRHAHPGVERLVIGRAGRFRVAGGGCIREAGHLSRQALIGGQRMIADRPFRDGGVVCERGRGDQDKQGGEAKSHSDSRNLMSAWRSAFGPSATRSRAVCASPPCQRTASSSPRARPSCRKYS